MTPSSRSGHVHSRLQPSRSSSLSLGVEDWQTRLFRAAVASIFVIVLSVSFTEVTHAASSRAISSKKLQGIWKIVKVEAYNPETKKFEDRTTDPEVLSSTQYFLFQKSQFCGSQSLPKGRCDDSPFEPFSVKGNIITIGEDSGEITLKGWKLILLVLPDKAMKITLKKVKKNSKK